ncbi:MAG: hypothetical protein F4139_02760 [Gemmatimonadetes bacterium]|nr:hypothetical protein [Gemmatimonadota bacterium]MYH51853.1 hypothetical protein [Gemmatimonadota bacterium]
MGKALKRFVTRTVVLLVAVVAAYVGWRWGGAVFPRVEAKLGIGEGVVAEPQVTAETAALVTERIREFQASDEPELRLESAEVSSLLRYAAPGIVPAGVLDPGVSFNGDRMEIRARVVPGGIADLSQLGAVAAILPDTVDVVVEGSLGLFGDAQPMLLVEGIELQGWPVPAAAVPEILAAFRRGAPPGMPASAVPVPAVGGLKGTHIENGKLVVVRAQ